MRRLAPLTLVAAMTLAACNVTGSSSSSAPIPMESGPSTSPSTAPSISPSDSAHHGPAVVQDEGVPKIQSIKRALPGIEHFVEQERGLKFKKPVKAKLLGRKAFVAKLDHGDSAPKPKAVEKQVAILSSLGLIPASTDLAAAFKKANDEGTLGFYAPKSKRLYVLGTKATPGVRAVLSHELTHALTDQYFGIRRPKLNKDKQELSIGFTALVEGDAERTRKAYEREVLSPQERKLADRQENAGGTPNVPEIVLEIIGFPYGIGPDFVDALVTHGGIAALNAAYRKPPTSSLQLVDPQKYFEHDNPMHVATPEADRTVLEHGDLGFVGLVLMLENGLPRSQAPFGLLDWGGDQFAAWRASTGRYCMRDTVVMANEYGTNEIRAALKAWIATRHHAAHIEHEGKATTFITCSS